jgi:hypothetical protein
MYVLLLCHTDKAFLNLDLPRIFSAFLLHSVLYINIQLSSLKFIQLLRCILYDGKIRFYIIYFINVCLYLV